jgi:hypothetical protein
MLSVSCFIPFAQSDRGPSRDHLGSTSAVIPGATSSAVQCETGPEIETISTETGNYTSTQVPPGAYQLIGRTAGFKKYVRQGITCLVAQTLRIDVPLEVGARRTKSR